MIHVCVRWVLALLGTASAVIVCQSKPREVLPLQENWEFYFAYNTRRDAPKQKVTLPHTWNASEVPGAGMAYYRGTGNYSRRLRVENRYRGKRLFLRFEGVNSVAHVFINQKLVGEHQGGYTAFCLEITSFVKYGEENLLTVLASNAYNPAVLPFSGDFNVYGGIHRPAWLLVTEANCISPLDHASSGVYLEQSQVSRQAATVKVRTRLSLAGPAAGFRLQTTIRDAAGKTVLEQTVPVPNTDTGAVSQTFTLQKPRLWNGKADPYRYQVTAQLLAGEKILDAVTQPLGLRYYRVDPQGGFFLNGQYLDLRGFCRHEDVQGKGSALSREDHQRDMDLLKEIGATALRLTHYPHSEYFYELCDQRGIVVWTEIPLVGPGGYTGAGYVKSPRLEAHGRQVLKEMIRQQYNHPSICFWGLFNELKMDYDDPVPYLRELNELAKQEDPARPTVSATFLDEEGLNGVTHLIAWNKYFGWYGGKPEEMGTWADQAHAKYPRRGIAVSEYGAGGSIRQHEDSLRAPNPGGPFHPEGWQAYFHEGNWQEMAKRPFVWGKYIWVLADFGSSIRQEGDTAGINDKGLVTYDRQVKKDAFYFYKANWNPEPMLYLADRRHTRRSQSLTSVKVYTNLKNVELLVNGRSYGKQPPSAYGIIRWEGVALADGRNQIKIRGRSGSSILEDADEWILK